VYCAADRLRGFHQNEGRRKALSVAVKKIVVEIDPCSDRDLLNVA